MSHFMQPPAYLTEEEIFNSDINPPEDGNEFGDGVSEEYVHLALQRDNSQPEVVCQSMLLDSTSGSVDMHSTRAIHRQMQPASDDDVQELMDIPCDPTHVTHREQMWKNEGLEQVVHECDRRSRNRLNAASFFNATPAPIRFRGKRHPKPSSVRGKWRVERENPLATIFEQRTALHTDPNRLELHYFPSPFPSSRLQHPFRLPTPGMYPVLNSSDFAQTAAPIQQVTTPTLSLDYMSERPIPSSTSVHFFVNPHLRLIGPAPMTLPIAAPLVDFFVAPTTKIDPLEVSMAVLKQVPAPSLAPDHISEPIPSSAPVQFIVNPHLTLIDPAVFGLSRATAVDSTAVTTIRTDPSEVQVLEVQYGPRGPNSMSSTLIPEVDAPNSTLVDAPNSTLLQLDVHELQAVLADQALNFANISQTAAVSRAQQQQGTVASRVTNPVQFVMETHEHSMVVPDNKRRLRWTPELHEKFVAAVASLGGPNKCTAKTVSQVMACPDINIRHVKSHLQKFRSWTSTKGTGSFRRGAKRQRHMV